MGAIAFQKGLGVNHSMAHALSTVCDLHHGLANGIVLPYTMEFNQQKIPGKFHTLCNTLGINDFIQWIVDLKNQIGIPEKLSSLKVGTEHMDPLVEVALSDGCHQLNPRPVTRDDFRTLFSKAF